MPESVMAVPRMPPLYALRAFEVAARFGSFTQAAQSLFITQSAVSRHVKTTESIWIASCSSDMARGWC